MRLRRKWRLEPKAAPIEMNPIFYKVARYFSSEYHSELLALIEDFGLEVCGETYIKITN